MYDEYCRSSEDSSSNGTSRTDAKEARCGLGSGGGSCNWKDSSLVVGKVVAVVESLYKSVMETGGDCSVKESSWWMGEWTWVLLAEQGWSCSHSSVLGPQGESYQDPSELSELPLLVLAVEEVEGSGGPLWWPSCLLLFEPGRLGVEEDSKFGENLRSCTGPEASSRRR